MRRVVLLLLVFPLACAAEDSNDTAGATTPTTASPTVGATASGGETEGGSTGGDSATSTSTSSSSTTGAASTSDTSTSTGDGPKFDLPAGVDTSGGEETTPVRMIPGLLSITFYERTGGAAPTSYTFTVDGPELSARLPDPLTDQSFDISGATGEFYDVYYSDVEGSFELDGLYLTISGDFSTTLPAGGGLNLAEIGLNFDDDTTEFGNYVASYAILGDNAVQPDGNVENSIDGDLQTHTTMGNNVASDERLRVTLGFESSSGPPPG